MLIIKIHNVVITPNQFKRNYHNILDLLWMDNPEELSISHISIIKDPNLRRYTFSSFYLVNFSSNCKLCIFILDSIFIKWWQFSNETCKYLSGSFGNNDGHLHTDYGPVVTFTILNYTISTCYGVFKPCNKLWHVLDIIEV